MEYCENASRLRAFVPGTGARPIGMGLPRVALVKLNRLRTGVGRFHSSMHKGGLAPSPNCECGASEQTADHVLTACPINWAPHGARGLAVLDHETRCWVRRRLKGIHSKPDTNRTGAEGLSFYYPRLLNCLDQMLAVMLLSQHRVSSSKTVRPRAPCGARCMGHAVSTWSAVCSEAPHSQFGEGARPHLCMDEWNRPTPVRRRLSLTQVARGKPIPTGLTLVPGTKARSLEALSQYSAFHL